MNVAIKNNHSSFFSFHTEFLYGTLKFGMLFCLIIEFLIKSICLKIMNATPEAISLLISRSSKKTLKLLDIKIKSNFHHIPRSGLIVANHCSYVDVLILASEIPSLFITSTEVKNSGWTGWVCKLAGCFFVERRNKNNLKNDINLLNIALLAEFLLVLFPEGTTNDGKSILTFKSSLFDCAIRSQQPIHNYCIKYEDPNEVIAYYGDMKIIPHLFKLCLNRKTVTAQLHFAGTLITETNDDRKSLSLLSRNKILNSFYSSSLKS